MITIAEVADRVKARLGTSVHKLELTEEEIGKCLRDETLRTLSIYFPREEVISVQPGRDDYPGDPDRGSYRIRSAQELEVVGVVELIGLGMSARHGTGLTHVRRVMSFQDIVSEKLVTMTEGLSVPYQAQFEPPDKARISPNPPEEPFLLRIHTVHGGFGSFPLGLRETIMRLAECDVRLDVLGARQHFTSVSAEFAEIELNLGPFEEARTQRDELIERMTSKKHLTSTRKKVWVY